MRSSKRATTPFFWASPPPPPFLPGGDSREARLLQRQVSIIGLRGIGGYASAGVEEHDAILMAIRDGEPHAAAPAACVHLDNTPRDYRREIQRRVFG
jgi:GntR family transcriptional repressor for pyruvate dehydrogenase complex